MSKKNLFLRKFFGRKTENHFPSVLNHLPRLFYYRKGKIAVIVETEAESFRLEFTEPNKVFYSE